jgi:copper transport protein
VAAALPGQPRGRLLAAIIPRFSRWALVSVGLLVISGLYQTWLHVGSLEALVATAYGQALLVKLALLAPLLALAALNLVVLSPRVSSAVSRASRAAVERLTGLERVFRGAVRAETLLAVLILGVVGVLTSLEPARDALRAQGVTRTVQAEDVRAVLRIAPGEAGLNTFDVALSESGRPLTDAQRVTVRASHLEHEMGVSEQRLEPTGDGHYRAMSGLLSMAGEWDLQFIVRREGSDDVEARLQYRAPDAGGGRNQPGTPYVTTAEPPTRLLLGGLVLALGVLLLVEAIRPVRRRRRAATMLLGCVAVTVGLTLQIAAALYSSSADAVIPNPVPATAASVARGQELFQQNCVACHGVSGRGDGPLARTLNPRPADLRVHTTQHTEGQLWLWITDGVPGSAMPSFRTTLSDEDRWNLVNYLRSQYAGVTAARPP